MGALALASLAFIRAVGSSSASLHGSWSYMTGLIFVLLEMEWGFEVSGDVGVTMVDVVHMAPSHVRRCVLDDNVLNVKTATAVQCPVLPAVTF